MPQLHPPCTPEMTAEESQALESLAARLGRLYVRQRLGLEREFEQRKFRRRSHVPHVGNTHSARKLIRVGLCLGGLYGRGRRNARRIETRVHQIGSARLPSSFDGFTILQLTDIHADISGDCIDTIIAAIRPLTYDVCVLTGDYRAHTYGDFRPALAAMVRLRPHIKGEAYGVLGNHDSIRMVPGLEQAGYRMLINECTELHCKNETIYLAGIDDAHSYRLDNFDRAAEHRDPDRFTILLSHTPETYRRASHADVDLMLSGHTHGGQICLPGGVPIITEAGSPRRLARGPWQHGGMKGYTSAGAGTSILDVRLNCPPEVTLHVLRRR